jgi:two-component system, cell cycle sensor histidine kinase and response regulator CckA
MCVSGEEGRYVFANEAFAALVGIPLAELLASDPYQIWVETTHPDDLAVERDALERIAKGEIERFQIEKRLSARGGSPRWVRVDVVGAREPTGRLETITAFFTDIDEQKTAAAAIERLEAQLRQTQKLDAIGKLAGGVAHDFNNRLLIIMGYTELLKRALPLDSALAQHAEMVLSSAQRSAELTRQLLAYSRRQVLQPEPFDLNVTVDHMHQLLERVIGDRVELVTALGARHAVFSDPGQIEQVILNLAINARDAMPAGGRLTLETCDLSLPSEGDGSPPCNDYVVLIVSDTGTGIPQDVLPHIFEPFFTTKEVGQGTGLGLSMVDGIVNQSGGAVKVATRVGAGTRFEVRLPRAREPAAPSLPYKAVSAPHRALNLETVLICDDDEDVRRLLMDILGLRAYSLLEARNGRHALELAHAHEGRIDLLITDLVMPGLGGIDLAAALRARDPSLRVLYVSGYTEKADLLAAPLDPRTQFLAKPFLPGDLTRAVFDMLESHV